MAGRWWCLVRGGEQHKTRCSDFLREGEMRDTEPAARWRRQGRGRADTCGANPSLGDGNPHRPSLAWSSWEVSVRMGSGWECWKRVSCHTLPLKATGARMGQSHRSCLLTTASQTARLAMPSSAWGAKALLAHSNVASSNAVIMGGIFRHSSRSSF